VPACSSSPIPAIAHRLTVPAALAPHQCRSLLDDLAQLADPRHRRGRRHALGTVLAVAVAAVLAGAKSMTAIGEWAADAPGSVLAALGARRDPLRRVWRPPGEATVRRVLARVDPETLDADHTRDRGHGRVETRRLQVTTIAGLDFPHATQAIRLTRRVRPLTGRRWRTVTVYAVTSLTAAQASLPAWPTGSAGTGASRRCTTSATPPLPRTPARSAPAPPPGRWPACVTSPSASCTPAATATSPPRCASGARDATRILPLLGVTSP
jgi:hypothetical protein